jgi:hypothetical protein
VTLGSLHYEHKIQHTGITYKLQQVLYPGWKEVKICMAKNLDYMDWRNTTATCSAALSEVK